MVRNWRTCKDELDETSKKAIGFLEEIYTYKKTINGKEKILFISVKITDNVDRATAPYKNSVTVSQEN